ncbi:MAG: DUF1501 domain-containing protein [Gemmataceae bacterium]|nr:DUF1501 domain-containing protein [Gemmataceae bacterium]
MNSFRHANLARRDCLKLGLGALMGGGLSGALKASSMARGKSQAKSVILVWLDGGPTHYETFDPKPDAPLEIRGNFSPIATKVPGIKVSQHLPKLAAIAHRLAILRSVRHDQGNHGAGNHYMMTGAPPRIPVGCGAFVSYHPSLGSVTASEIPAPEGLPSYFSLPSMTRSGGPNFLGSKFAPFVVDGSPNSPNFRVRDVTLPKEMDGAKTLSRQEMRQAVDRFARFADKQLNDPSLALDDHYRQGLDLMRSARAQAAFDIHNEPDRIRDSYGRNDFGQRALLARRLVEAGVPFIVLNEGGWDHHGGLFPALEKRLPTFDATLAALIEDMAQRGILDSTLVLVLGEFGRTPQINKDGGRDHWSNAMSILFAGGGTPGGQVIGATDRQGYAAVERVLSPEHFAATVYAKLGIDPAKILYAGNGRPAHLVSNPETIAELMG